MTDLKTKKTVTPITTPSPAIPKEKFIQHEDRDSGILPLKVNKPSINANLVTKLFPTRKSLFSNHTIGE